MKDEKELIVEAKNLISSYDGTGLLVATIQKDDTLSIVAKTDEKFNVVLISELYRSLLQENSCCQLHFMATSVGMLELMKNVTLEENNKLSAENGESVH